MIKTELQNIDFGKLSETKKKLYEKYLPILYNRYNFLNNEDIVKIICYNSITQKIGCFSDDNEFIIFCDKDGNILSEDNCFFDEKKSEKIKFDIDYPDYIIKTNIFYDGNIYKINIIKFVTFCGTGIHYLIDEFSHKNTYDSSDDSLDNESNEIF